MEIGLQNPRELEKIDPQEWLMKTGHFKYFELEYYTNDIWTR